MPPKSNVPIRIGGSKVRSGCRTCKQRHVKCDEARPVCSRCQKAGRNCTYDQPPSTKLQQGGISLDRAEPLSMALHLRDKLEIQSLKDSIGFYGTRDVAEVSAVKYFTLCLGKELAGCFSDDVWCHVLPQVAHHEPAVWQAIVAVSTLDSNIQTGYNPGDVSYNSNLAIRHYSKAIQELNVRLESPEEARRQDVVLLSCLLFAVFECLYSNYQAALRHISGGMKLLFEWNYGTERHIREDNSRYLVHRNLQPIFLALDSQAIQMGVVDFREYYSLPAIIDQLHSSSSFATFEDAHLSLNQIFNRLSHWGYWIEPFEVPGAKPDAVWMAREEQILRNMLVEWDLAFDRIHPLCSPHPTAILLLIQRKVIETFFNRHADGPTETAWDNSLPLFQKAVLYAEMYMELTTGIAPPYIAIDGTNPRISGKQRPALTCAMDIVMSLFLICAKCRHSETRHRALAMLKICDRREGIWDSRMSAKVAERIIELEESAALEDGYIPDGARIYELDVRLGEDGKGEIKHKQMITGEDGYHGVEIATEPLTW